MKMTSTTFLFPNMFPPILRVIDTKVDLYPFFFLVTSLYGDNDEFSQEIKLNVIRVFPPEPGPKFIWDLEGTSDSLDVLEINL